MTVRFLMIVSEEDPVAPLVAERWGTPPSSGAHVDGLPIRTLSPGVEMLRRPGLHIRDDDLDRRLPSALREGGVTLVFPSVHRSESGTPCFTVHPLGNPGADAEVGGRPGVLVPTAPRSMASALRALAEAGRGIALGATYEATHHGPSLTTPAFFAEIGFGSAAGPPAEAVRALAAVLSGLAEDPSDRIAVGAGGGHYVPHFTELALRRRWAFGHLLPRHALDSATAGLLLNAVENTPGAEGVLFARAADAGDPRWVGQVPRLREGDAPKREAGSP
jgi:D-tyrosyl-tRNA(Tyr) deacylase